MAKNPNLPQRGTPTSTNIGCLDRFFGEATEVRNQMHAVEYPHVTRCMKAGLIVATGPKKERLTLTTLGALVLKTYRANDRRYTDAMASMLSDAEIFGVAEPAPAEIVAPPAPERLSCKSCNGSGVTGPELGVCPECKGDGREPLPKDAGPRGLTAEDVEELAHVGHQTASARIHDLERRGVIEAVEQRPTRRSGRPAWVWRAVSAEALEAAR